MQLNAQSTLERTRRREDLLRLEALEEWLNLALRRCEGAAVGSWQGPSAGEDVPICTAVPVHNEDPSP